MNTNSQDIRFLELLRKWRTGDFTRADEREMWTLAADDPFRQEAMEGMLEHPEMDHVAALSTLRAGIREKRRKRLAGFPQLLAVAAALVLIFGAIWFFNIRPLPPGEGQMARELPTDAGEQQESPAPIEFEAPSSAPARSKSAPGSAASTAPDLRADEILADKESGPTIAEAKDDSKEYDMQRDAALSKPSVFVPQPPGTVRDMSTNSRPNAERAKTEAGYAAKKRSSYPAPDLGQNQNQMQNQQNNAGSGAISIPMSNQPTEGWFSFRINLSNKARLTPEALANNVSGTVRLEFVLDDKNQPSGFKIINSLGYGCDEAAIQLIKEFTWFRVNDQVVTVDVPFVR